MWDYMLTLKSCSNKYHDKYFLKFASFLERFRGSKSTDSASIGISFQITINQFFSNNSYCHINKRFHRRPHCNLPDKIHNKIEMDKSLYTIRPAIKDDCMEIRRLIQVKLLFKERICDSLKF